MIAHLHILEQIGPPQNIRNGPLEFLKRNTRAVPARQPYQVPASTQGGHNLPDCFAKPPLYPVTHNCISEPAPGDNAVPRHIQAIRKGRKPQKRPLPNPAFLPDTPKIAAMP
jgi:hypothetical protein